MSEAKYNLRNPAVKRILQEIREMDQDNSKDFVAQALEDNIFEWHFVIRGPPDTEFDGGIYHGRILLPPEYPFRPPSFMMLTKNGRFETNTKICLSISDYHPEHWQPSWSVRTALTALVAFLPSPAKGALGSIELSEEIRKKLAIESRGQVVEFGNAERTQLARELNAKLLQRIKEPSSPLRSQPSPLFNPTPLCDRLARLGNERRAVQNGTRATVAHEQREVLPVVRIGTAEWMWTSLIYIIGFLILAIVLKKILIKSGTSSFAASTE